MKSYPIGAGLDETLKETDLLEEEASIGEDRGPVFIAADGGEGDAEWNKSLNRTWSEGEVNWANTRRNL